MEDVIKKIINIEAEAQKTMDSAEKEKIDRTKELEERLKVLKTKLSQDAINKVASIREKEISATKEIVKKREQACNEQLKKIQSYLDKSGEKWSEDLVKAVLMR